MKNLVIFLLLLTSCEFSLGQNSIKTNGTALPVDYRNCEINLFSNGRCGIGQKSEINLHPAAFFIMPHIHFKRQWFAFNIGQRKIAFAGRHGLYYSKILTGFTRTQAWLPNRFRASETAPHALGFNNEILFSTFLKQATHCDAPDHLMTLKIGAKYAYSSDTSLNPVITAPVFHRETTAMLPELLWNIQLASTGHLGNYLYYFADLAFHSYKFKPENFSAESKLGIYAYTSPEFSFTAGAKMTYSNHPDVKTFTVYPLLNISYFFQRKKGKERGLHKKDRFKFENI